MEVVILREIKERSDGGEVLVVVWGRDGGVVIVTKNGGVVIVNGGIKRECSGMWL